MKKLLLHQLILLFFLGAIASLKSQCTPTTVPYYESLETITINNQLPACWGASDLGNACKTFTTGIPKTGQKYAGFFSGPLGLNYFYSQGLILHPGITYSAAVWKMTSVNNSTNWSFGLMLATSQSSNGLTNITSSSPATSNLYTSTSNTFNVSTSGTYYILVEAQSLAGGTGEYLYWDDLSVTIPCNIAGNSPSITVVPSSTPVCTGSQATLTAFGAHTYTWYNGAQGNTIVISPTYTWSSSALVLGTNTLSGCITMGNGFFISLSPIMFVSSPKPLVCSGESVMVTVTVTGAQNISWSTGATGLSAIITPTANSQYTVIGTNHSGCSTTRTFNIGVNPLPVITVNPASYDLCTGNTLSIQATGAMAYNWEPSSTTGTSLNVSPAVSTNYTITGTDGNGCKSTSISSVTVSDCVGIAEKSKDDGISVFPNPCHDILIVSGNSITDYFIYDLTGRAIIIKSDLTTTDKIAVGALKPGVYILSAGQKKIRFVKE